MARITVPGFSGVVRILAPQRLEDHQAQEAVDCDFRSLDLRPYYGDRVTTAYGGPYSAADPSTLFLYDTGKLVVADGDYNFARSPVFFSDNPNNDKRVFYSDQTVARIPDTLYPMVLETLSASGPLPAGAKRLGVPKPGPITNLDFTEQTGSLTRIALATNANITVRVAPGAADRYDAGDKLLLETPGLVAGTYTIANKTLVGVPNSPIGYDLSLSSTKRAWRQVSMKTKAPADKSKDVTFTLTNHGFSDGDQVFFSHLDSGHTGLPTYWPSAVGSNLQRVFTVVNVTNANTFQLAYTASGDTTLLELSQNSDLLNTWTKKIALLAPSSATFTDPATVSVQLTMVKGTYQGTATYDYPSGGDTGTWSDANTADTVRDRAYVATFVNAFGDESEPSNPTKSITVVPGATVTLTLPGTSEAGLAADTNYLPISKIRLYRTDESGNFRFLVEKPWAAAGVTLTETTPDTELAEPLSTTGWEVPKQGTKGLVNCPNGVIAGFRGRTIFGSVPYAPYAWPLTNQVATDYDVVGLVPTSAGVVVVTKGMPAILIGDNPANWSMQKLEYPQGCVARRSIVDMGEFAMYASPDGLVAITGANVEILTKPIMTREQWQAYNPSSIIAAQVEGRYIATYIKNGARYGFIYDPQTQSFTDLTLTAVAFCNDLLNDVLLMLGADGRIYEWNQDTTTFKPYTWVSKWFQLPIPELMGVAQIFTTTIDLAGRSLEFTLHGYDNNMSMPIYTISTSTNPNVISGNRPFRIPYVAPGRFTAFKITLKGSIPVGTVMVGRVMDELKEAP